MTLATRTPLTHQSITGGGGQTVKRNIGPSAGWSDFRNVRHGADGPSVAWVRMVGAVRSHYEADRWKSIFDSKSPLCESFHVSATTRCLQQPCE